MSVPVKEDLDDEVVLHLDKIIKDHKTRLDVLGVEISHLTTVPTVNLIPLIGQHENELQQSKKILLDLRTSLIDLHSGASVEKVTRALDNTLSIIERHRDSLDIIHVAYNKTLGLIEDLNSQIFELTYKKGLVERTEFATLAKRRALNQLYTKIGVARPTLDIDDPLPEDLEPLKFDNTHTSIEGLEPLITAKEHDIERFTASIDSRKSNLLHLESTLEEAEREFVEKKSIIGVESHADLELIRASRLLSFKPHKKLRMPYRGLLRNAQAIPQETLPHYVRQKKELMQTVERRKHALETKLGGLRRSLELAQGYVKKVRSVGPITEVQAPQTGFPDVAAEDPDTISKILQINMISTKYDVCVLILEELQQFDL